MNYPKSYGSIRKGDYRLKDYIGVEGRKIDLVEKALWVKIKTIASVKKPVLNFEDFEYIASGWEWSVFRKDEKTVIKIPAGIFSEVNDTKYLENTKVAYETILKYFPQEYVAKTDFKRENGLNMMIQEYIEGDDSFIISYRERDRKKLRNADRLLGCALNMLEKEDWIPDLNVKRALKGYVFRAIIEEKTKCPKISDFTFYIDPYRMYPEMTKQQIEIHRKKILQLRRFIKRRID